MRAGQSDRNEIDDDRPENESDTPDAGKSAVKRAQITNGTAILGIPSTDGRGPM